MPTPAKAGGTSLKMKSKQKSPLQDTGKIPIEIVALSLRSTSPVKIKNKGLFDTKVSLDKQKSSKGGIEVVTHDKKGGEFLIALAKLFLRVDFLPVRGNPSKPIQELLPAGQVTATGGSWMHEPTDHYPTIPDKPVGNFFFSGPFEIRTEALSMSVAPAVTPEPVTFALLGGGLLLLGLGRRRGAARRAC